MPGEHTRVKIVAEGSNPHQGVAYLRDGTMVVVDNASNKIGQELEIEFVRLNQTASGAMMFAKPVFTKTNPKNIAQDTKNRAQVGTKFKNSMGKRKVFSGRRNGTRK